MSRGKYFRGWSVNRALSAKEGMILLVLARAAEIHIDPMGEEFKPDNNDKICFRRDGTFKEFITAFSEPDSSIITISFEEAVQFLTKRVKAWKRKKELSECSLLEKKDS